MTEVGFVGLGKMGQPIAQNLANAGFKVVAYNRTRERAEALQKYGVRVADSVREAAATGIVITMLADDLAVESVVLGEGGILKSLPAEGIHVSLSTISTALSARLTEAHTQAGQPFVASPVFGRPDAAAAGNLVVVAAGPAPAMERSKPLLEAIGRKLIVLGGQPMMANAVKLAGNFTIAAMLETLGEAFALVRKHGVSPGQFLEIVNGSLFQSPVYENYGRIVAEQKFEPAGFKLSLGLKDARLVLAAADTAEVPMPLASLIHDNLLGEVAHGKGDIDWAALAMVAAERAGL
jgi:3-hydroxyisobutyrate dehydrogenase-like beta-hydroxyacid dehydrogenase